MNGLVDLQSIISRLDWAMCVSRHHTNRPAALISLNTLSLSNDINTEERLLIYDTVTQTYFVV